MDTLSDEWERMATRLAPQVGAPAMRLLRGTFFLGATHALNQMGRAALSGDTEAQLAKITAEIRSVWAEKGDEF